MADENLKDIALRIAVSTSGAEQVNALATQIDLLAKEGGAAAPEFERLAAELRKLGEQDRAVAALGTLEAETRNISVAFSDARSQVAQLDGVLQQQTQTTQAFREQQISIANAVETTSAEIRKIEGDLRLLKASTDSAGKGTETYKTQVRDLATQLAVLRTTQSEQKAEQREINDATRQSEAALSSASKAYAAAVTSAANFGKELAAQNATLDKAKIELNELGISSTSFAQAQEEVAQRMVVLRTETTQLVEQQQRAVASTKALAQAGLELQAALQFEQETAQRLVTAQNEQAEAADRLAQATLREAAAQREAAVAAEQLLTGAFGTIGVRSIEAIRAEATSLDRALLEVKKQFESGAIGAESFSRAVSGAKVRLAELQAEAATLPALPGIFERISNSIGNLIGRFGALGASVGIVGIAVKPVFDLAIQIDNLRRALTTVTGSASGAEKQIQFLRDTANLSGVSVSSIADSFVRFTASMRSSNITAAQTQQVFSAVTNAAGNLGLSSDKVSHILDALGQMANKGVVSMEELRQQLGESLPGALGLMAKGLGITETQLVKLVESGQLLTSRALGPLADAMTVLGSKGKEVEGLQQSFNRLKNAIGEALQKATDSSAFKSLSFVIDGLAHNFGTAVDAMVIFGKALLAIKIVNVAKDFLGLGSAAKIVATEVTQATVVTEANTIATAGNSNAVRANTVARAENVAATRAVAAATAASASSVGVLGGAMGLLGKTAGGLLSILGGFPGAVLLVLLNIRELGTAIGESAAKLFGWGKVLSDSQKKMADSEKAIQKLFEAQKKIGDAWVQATVQYADALKPIEANIQGSERLAKAKKIEGEALTQIASLTGSEASRLNAASAAASVNEGATLAVVNAKQKEVDLLANYIAQLEAAGRAQGALTAAEKKALADEQQKLVVKQASLEQAKAEVDATHAQVAAAQLASEAYKDNSGRLAELKQAYESASGAAAINKQLAAEGVVSQDAVARSTEAAARAEYLYRDSINDTVQAAQRQVAGADVYNRLVGESAQSLKLSADAATNYAAQIELSVQAEQRQVAQLRESIEVLKENALLHGDPDGKIAQEIAAITQLTQAKQAELDRTRQAAQASKDEATARQLASETYKDNSGRLGELGSAARAAQAELARLNQLQKEGKATSDEVAAATRNAASAQKLYADALHDTTVKLQNQIILDQAAANQTQANLKLAGEQAKTQEVLARAQGDEAKATEAQIRQKQLEGQARHATADAMRTEADNTIKLAEQERDEARATGTLTPAKEAEIKARIANAQAKQTEAAATDETVNQINTEIDAIRNLNRAKAGGTSLGEGEAPVMGADGKPIRGVVQKTEFGGALDAISNLRQRRDLGLLSTSDKSAAEAAYQAETTTLQSLQSINQSFVSQGALTSASARARDAKQILDDIRAMERENNSPQTSSQGGNSNSGGSTHTVNINLGGSNTSIQTASAADAQNLANFLKSLGNDAGRANG